jgi:prepilin-type N-terminal cleavage/methylation domain-containing protein
MSSMARRYSGTAGFSLVEVLVALAIAALMTAMLTRFVAGTRVNAAKVTEVIEMAALGETLMARTASSQKLAPGRTQGRQDVFAWRIDIAPVSFEATATRVREKESAPAGAEQAGSVAMPAEPQSIARPAGNWAPYRVAIFIQSSSGQSYAIDTIRLGPGPR